MTDFRIAREFCFLLLGRTLLCAFLFLTPATGIKAATEFDSSINVQFEALFDPELDLIGGQWATVQDEQGFLWFGGDGGLARFDGYDFRVFRHEVKNVQSLSNNYVNDLLVDSRGTLWVATYWGLNEYDADLGIFKRHFHIPGTIPSLDFVDSPKAPMRVPTVIPGRIEAEFISSYEDTSSGNSGDLECGGLYVDMRLRGEEGNCIVEAAAGEWTEYAIEAPEEGLYELEFSASTTLSGQSLAIEVDGLNISGDTVLNAGKIDQFQIYSVPFYLSVGSHTVRFNFRTGNINLDYFEVTKGDKPQIADIEQGKRYSISHDSVISLEESHDGSIWIGTLGGGLNQYSVDTQRYVHFIHTPENPRSLAENNIRKVYEDTAKKLWVGTRNTGLDLFEPATQTFKHYRHDPGNERSISNDSITAIYEDTFGELWVGTEHGLNRFDKTRRFFKRYIHEESERFSVGGRYITGFSEDTRGNLWVTSDGGGLSIYNREADTFDNYSSRIGRDNGLVNDRIRSIFKDAQGSMWLGHFPAGLSQVDYYRSSFSQYKHDKNNERTIDSNEILSLYEGTTGRLWVGTERGLNVIEPDTRDITRLSDTVDTWKGGVGNRILSVLEEPSGDLWVGSWRDGLRRKLAGGTFFSPFTEFSNTSIWDIYKDRTGNIWVGSEFGLSLYKKNIGRFVHYRNNPDDPHSILPGQINTIHEDERGQLWVGGDRGLNVLDTNTGKFSHFISITGDQTSLSHNTVTDLYQGYDGKIWVSTLQGVNIYSRDTKRFKQLTKADGLADDVVRCSIEDNLGNMWFATGSGVTRFSKDGPDARTLRQEHGLAGNLYKRPACLKRNNGMLAFGSTQGLTIVNPERLPKNDSAPTVVLTKFTVANQPISVGENSPLKKVINRTETIYLDHRHSFFALEFSALNYIKPSFNQYAYKLDGFDSQWNYIGGRRSATYTNLDPGTYQFTVKASNNEGVWNDTGVKVSLIITPPWWRSIWAYLLYTVLFFCLCLQVVYIFWQKKRVEEERRRNQQLRQDDKMKDAFLASTSHELRTPLNGIIGLSESLISGATGDLPGSTLDNLKMISDSGRRLSSLINDILDFSKLREHALRLRMEPVDLAEVTSGVIKLSLSLLGQKSIKINNKMEPGQCVVQADRDRLQQILYNLIGNSIKFTAQGSVDVSAELDERFVWVHVKDTGVGITDVAQKHIFQAFEQADNGVALNSQGTGLGLAVTKQLVELHGGSVKVKSVVGEGTLFSFSLPLAENNDTENIVQAETNIFQFDHQQPQLEEPLTILDSEHSSESSSGKSFTILVVDDEPVNRQVLLNLLSPEGYCVIACDGGQAAIDRVNRGEPIDLVLLDVMMPEMSGYDVCSKLREAHSSARLPIIFLTAKNQVSDLEAGYLVGGNDYLIKPFLREELLAKVNTHLALYDMTRNLEDVVAERTTILHESYKELAFSYQALSRTKDKLHQSEKMSSLGVLVAGVGHEISNPVNYSNLLTAKLETDMRSLKDFTFNLFESGEESVEKAFEERFDKIFQNLRSVLDGNRRVMEIVENLRTFSRIEDKKQYLQPLKRGLDSTLRLVKAQFNQDVSFWCDFRDDPDVLCNASEMNQVFMNVIVNACQSIVKKYDTMPGVRGGLNLWMRIEGPELVIGFQDDGEGMSESVLNRMFEPFFSTKDAGEGTGLGMSVAYGIIEQHNGRLEVESEEGEGTVVRIVLNLPGNDGEEAS